MSFEDAVFKYEIAKRELKKYKERLDYLYELQYQTLDEFGKQLRIIDGLDKYMRIQGRREEMARRGLEEDK